MNAKHDDSEHRVWPGEGDALSNAPLDEPMPGAEAFARVGFLPAFLTLDCVSFSRAIVKTVITEDRRAVSISVATPDGEPAFQLLLRAEDFNELKSPEPQS